MNETISTRPATGLRLAGWGLAAAMLATPFVAMQMTKEVNWTSSDFVVFGAMLALAGGAIELLVRAANGAAYKLGATLAVVTGFLLVWANLAVGFIGDPDNPQNLLYLLVLASAVAGTIVARRRPRGMAVAMAAAGAIQLAIPIAVGAMHGPEAGATILYTLLWAASAWLLALAARKVSPAG
jgi:hypothetical protein